MVRCAPEYYQWVRDLADHVSLNITQAVVHGLLRLAESSGYHARMPRRYEPKHRRDPT